MSFVSYAQNFEDVMLWRALQHIKNGFYIDVGANDPQTDSVTKAFYDSGWSGINIEPLEKHWSDLQESRIRDVNLQCAAGAELGEIELWECDVRGWATASKDVINLHSSNGHEGQYKKVPVRTLSSICEEFVNSDIHFLKIDVEGFEEAVIKGMDFDRFRPWIMVVEATKPNSMDEVYAEWEEIVLNNKYLLAYCDGLNRFYVAKEHSNLLNSLRYPPNVFDNFIRAEQLHSELRAQQAESRIQIELTRFQQAEVKAQQAEVNAQEAEEKAQQAEEKAQQAEAKVQQAEITITELYNSRSWRITHPLRWFVFQVQLLRMHGVKNRIKAAARKGAVPMLRTSVSFVNSRPQLRQQLVGITKKTGTYKKIKSIYHRLQHVSREDHALVGRNESQVYQSSLLTPHARQIYHDLKTAIEKNKEQQ